MFGGTHLTKTSDDISESVSTGGPGVLDLPVCVCSFVLTYLCVGVVLIECVC